MKDAYKNHERISLAHKEWRMQNANAFFFGAIEMQMNIPKIVLKNKHIIIYIQINSRKSRYSLRSKSIFFLSNNTAIIIFLYRIFEILSIERA